jgi:hypothetical protein
LSSCDIQEDGAFAAGFNASHISVELGAIFFAMAVEDDARIVTATRWSTLLRHELTLVARLANASCKS